MGKYFMGRDVQLLTEEEDDRIQICHMNLMKPELGHMPFIREKRFTFLLVEKGGLLCQINQEQTRAEAGEALFINEAQSWRLLEAVDEECEVYYLSIAEEYLFAGDRRLGDKYGSQVAQAEAFPFCRFLPSQEEDSDEDILLGALLSAVQTADGRDLAYELDLKSWLLTAWGSLYKKFCQQTSDCKNAVIRERGKLNRMTEYLTKHCNEKLTLSGIADACQVSSGDFCRFFKKHMGMTPFEYLQKCRIWNSMDAVLEKTAPMSEIAAANGFTGASYFSETFRKEMGCSPAEYRKWYKGITTQCPVIFYGEKGENEGAEEKKAKVPSYLL